MRTFAFQSAFRRAMEQGQVADLRAVTAILPQEDLLKLAENLDGAELVCLVDALSAARTRALVSSFDPATRASLRLNAWSLFEMEKCFLEGPPSPAVRPYLETALRIEKEDLPEWKHLLRDKFETFEGGRVYVTDAGRLLGSISLLELLESKVQIEPVQFSLRPDNPCPAVWRFLRRGALDELVTLGPGGEVLGIIKRSTLSRALLRSKLTLLERRAPRRASCRQFLRSLLTRWLPCSSSGVVLALLFSLNKTSGE